MSATLNTSPSNPTNQIILNARDLPELLVSAKAIDPPLYTSLMTYLNGSPWSHSGAVGVLAGGISLLATRYGLGWSPDFDNWLALVVTCGVGYLCQMIPGGAKVAS